MRKYLLIIVIVTTATGPSLYAADTTYQIISSKHLNSHNQKIANQALGLFSKNCLPLMKEHTKDIESITLIDGAHKSDYGCMDYRCDDYGWEKELRLKVKIKDTISTFRNDMVRIRGHTLHFWLGGPLNPGVTTSKFPEVCGVSRPLDGADTYISIPSMGILW